MLWTTEKTTIWRTVNEQKPKLCTIIARVFRSRRRFCAISYTSKNPAKQSSWLDSLVAAMWFEHMTLRVWKIKIGNKRHGWRGGCVVVEAGRFVWIKHIDKHNRLMKATTVRRFQTVWVKSSHEFSWNLERILSRIILPLSQFHVSLVISSINNSLLKKTPHLSFS